MALNKRRYMNAAARDKSHFIEVYVLSESHRSLAPLGMTERRIVVTRTQ